MLQIICDDKLQINKTKTNNTIFFVSLLGYVSDNFVAKFGISKHGHPRHYVFIVCFAVTSVGLAALTIVNANSTIYLTSLGFFIGFGIYSALSLCGVLAIELAAEDIAGMHFSNYVFV